MSKRSGIQVRFLPFTSFISSKWPGCAVQLVVLFLLNQNDKEITFANLLAFLDRHKLSLKQNNTLEVHE